MKLTEQQPFFMYRQTEWMLIRLNDAGVEFSLDDFGTGCSVSSYLKYFPVSYIKMDKSFTQDVLSEKSTCILENVVGLAELLGIDTMTEGGTREQVKCLSSLGRFGRPKKVASLC